MYIKKQTPESTPRQLSSPCSRAFVITKLNPYQSTRNRTSLPLVLIYSHLRGTCVQNLTFIHQQIFIEHHVLEIEQGIGSICSGWQNSPGPCPHRAHRVMRYTKPRMWRGRWVGSWQTCFTLPLSYKLGLLSWGLHLTFSLIWFSTQAGKTQLS